MSFSDPEKINLSLKKALNIYEERQRRVKTTDLNIFIKQTIAHYPPPAVKGKNLSIKLTEWQEIMRGFFCCKRNHFYKLSHFQ